MEAGVADALLVKEDLCFFYRRLVDSFRDAYQEVLSLGHFCWCINGQFVGQSGIRLSDSRQGRRLCCCSYYKVRLSIIVAALLGYYRIGARALWLCS